MPLFLISLEALAPLFLLIGVGYLLKRVRLLHTAHVPVLNSLVLKVTLPALIIQSLTTAPVIPHAALMLPPALIVAQAVTLLAGWGIGAAMRLPMPVRGALMVAGAFGNTGFLGYPMTLALHPARLPEAILLDQFGMGIALYLGTPIIGAHFGTAGGVGRDAAATLMRFLRSPLFFALLIGSLIRLVPWPPTLLHLPGGLMVGDVVGECLSYLGAATTPVVLLALGVALSPSLEAFVSGPVLTASALKLILCPIAMVLTCHALHLPKPLVSQGLLSAAMPTSVMASVLAAEHDLTGVYAVSVVFVSTILAAVSVPVLLSFLK